MSSNDSNDSILGLLRDAAEFNVGQAAAGKAIATGLFRLAQARHGARGSRLSVEDCRLEIDPTRTLVAGELKEVGAGGTDPLLLVSALPHPHLRSAQAEFVAALQELTNLADVANRIVLATR